MEAPSRIGRFLDWITAPARGSTATLNGNGRHGAKGPGPGGSGVSIIPGVNFAGFTDDNGIQVFHSILGGASSHAERVSAATAYIAAAYAFAAMRYRAARVAEPPVIVVQEDAKTGDETWIPNHPLADLLEMPSPDYDMGELLFRTQVAVDQGGQALWVIDADQLGRAGRLSLFSASEFEVRSSRDLLRATFQVQTATGPRTFDPSRVILFQEPDPNQWLQGLPRLEVYLGWLNLAQQTRKTVEDLLQNSVWPSVILQPDPAWNPGKEEFDEYKAAAESYSTPGRRGKPLTMLGGGNATVVSARIRDLLPSDILNRVESVASVVFGVPAIVLQFQVGMENSPWSQMAEARRMCYEDTIEPLWREFEKRLTRQLLRPIDTNRRRLIRFDTSKVRALMPDRERATTMAVAWSRIASLNERRALVGLEPVEDPAANEIPELRPPEPSPFGSSLFGTGDPERASGPTPATKARRRNLFAALRRDQADRTEFDWQILAQRHLENDRAEVVKLAEQHLGQEKADSPSPNQRRRFIEAVSAYLKGASADAWRKAIEARTLADAGNAAAVLTADLGFRFDLVRPNIAEYAKREAAWLVTQITDTTRTLIADVVAKGVEDGLGARAIASKLASATAFSRDRALLVARTEATRVNNGAPVEALQAVTRETGTEFVKTWTTAGDDRVRDEHVAMEGETVGVDEKFSNGLAFPSEPNCRCILTFSERPRQ